MAVTIFFGRVERFPMQVGRVTTGSEGFGFRIRMVWKHSRGIKYMFRIQTVIMFFDVLS